jgi:small ligand-binding sensory domain FIST
MAMHTTTIAKIAAKLRSTRWLEELSASLASFLTVTQPQWALSLAVRQPSKALYTGYGLSPSAQPYAMLIASDVSRRSYGLMS